MYIRTYTQKKKIKIIIHKMWMEPTHITYIYESKNENEEAKKKQKSILYLLHIPFIFNKHKIRKIY